MNKKQRREMRRAEKKAAEAVAKQPWATVGAGVTSDEAAAIQRASDDAVALKGSFNTLEEANSALSETAKVISMKERQKSREKAAKKGGSKGNGKPAAEAKGRQSGLPQLPSLPKVPGIRKPKPEVDCLCGCGGKTKSKFMPGHDSYLRSLVLRVERKIMTLDEVEKKVSKGHRAAVEREIAAKKKEARATKKTAGKEPVKQAAQMAPEKQEAAAETEDTAKEA